MDRILGKVYETDNYSKFKRLVGNRTDDEIRGRNLLQSIKTFGQLEPITCNEKFEVIDGQARLYACKELNIPVKYRVETGYGLAHCREENVKANNWLIKDYIHSYAEKGNTSYKYLVALKMQSDKRPFTLIANIAKNVASTGGGINHKIKAGTFTLTTIEYEEAQDILNFLDKVDNCILRGGVSISAYSIAIACIYRLDCVDKSRLYKAIRSYSYILAPAINIVDAIENIDACYNYHLKNSVLIKNTCMKLYNIKEKSRNGKPIRN